MSKIAKITLCVTLTVLLLGAYFIVSAAGTASTGPNTKNIAISTLPSLHVPNNYEGLRANFNTSFICATPCQLGSGFTIEDSVLWQCGSTGASTCSMVVNSYATTSGGGVADDDRAICLVLDGAIVGACAYDGYDAADGSFSGVSTINTVSGIPTGNHNSFTLFYSSYGTALYTFANQYNVYKP